MMEKTKHKVYIRAKCPEGKPGDVITKPSAELIEKARADKKHNVYRLYPLDYELENTPLNPPLKKVGDKTNESIKQEDKES